MKKSIDFTLLALLLLGTFLPKTILAQDEFGGHVRGQNWQILRSDAVRVIYPKGMDTQAQRIAHIINYMDQNTRRSIGTQRRRFDMVLQNRTVNPNGYVGLAPLRSEFFGTPPQDNLLLGSMDWLDGLAVHEYRHVQQQLNAKRGLTRLGYWLQGEKMWALLGGVSVPNWYTEGDAVITETALTLSGRGRAPFFSMEQRALARADKNYAYLKHRNGSYKSLLPDHYRLGYMILTKTRNDFGNDITQKIHQDGASYRGIIYPFARAMRRNTKTGVKKMYKNAWEEKKTDWAEQLKNTAIIPTVPVTEKAKRTVTDYRFPRVLGDGSVVARKSSYKRTDALVQISPDGKEKKLCTIGISSDNGVTENNGKFAWTENARDGRRGYLEYSNLVGFDLQTGKRRQITNKTRLFSPAFSPKGDVLAAIYISNNQENNLVLLDPQTGAERAKIANPKNYFLARLAWSEDGQSLVTVAKYNNHLALIKFDVATGSITELTGWSHHTMDAPSVSGNQVFFNAGYSGIDNIYRTDLGGSKNIQQITSVPVGAFDPEASTDGKNLFFTEFTEMGYVMSKQNIATGAASRSSFQITEPAEMLLYETVATKTEGGNILEKLGSETYKTEPFKGLLRGQKLHSWSVTPSISKPALEINMDNLLNDVSIDLGGSINLNEGNAKTYSAAVEIGRFFPAISLLASQGGRQTDYYSNADTIATQKFNETLAGGTVAIPLKWQRGNYTTVFKPQAGVNYRNLQNIKVEGQGIADNNFTTLETGVEVSSIRRKAYQNVGPRAGFSLNLGINTTLSGAKSERLVGTSAFYLPGLGANHHIKITAAYQRELLKNPYQFADEFEYTRGYVSPVNDAFTNFTVNYGMPLLYPDFGIAGITYFKRVRTNLFYDAGIGENRKFDTTTNFRSAGVELIFDNVMLNFIPISFGFRNSFLLDKDLKNPDRKSRFEFFVAGGI